MENYGSLTNGDLFSIDEVERVLDNIQAGLDVANDKTDIFEYKNKDYAILAPHILRVQGPSGTKLAYEDWQVFWQDAGTAISLNEYNETYNEWTLRSRSFETADGSFTPKFFRNELKMQRNPLETLQKRAKGIMKNYLNKFKPNYLWEAILDIPVAGGNYYSHFGVLRDTLVDSSMIEDVIEGATDGAKGSLVRNHLRAIANPTGIESEDLTFFKEYMAEYVGIDPEDIVMAGNLGTGNTLRSVFSDTLTLDNIAVNGLPAEGIEGMPFVTTKMLPDNILMMYVSTPDEPIVAELVNNTVEFQGLNVVPETSLKKFPESINELIGSKYIIEDIGEHLIARHKVMFIDITPDASHANSDRLMQQAGIDMINRKKKRLHEQWKKTVK